MGSILFYARSVDSTFLVGLNSIVMQQTSATDNTLKRTEDLLAYAATHLNANIRYRASEMILQHGCIIFIRTKGTALCLWF